MLYSLLETESHAFTHLSFGLAVGLCAYNFFRAITLDPGTCPKPASDGELKSVRECTSYYSLLCLNIFSSDYRGSRF